MFFSLYPHARRLQRLLERLLLLTLLGTALAAALFTLLFLLRQTYPHGLFLVALGALLLLLRAVQVYGTRRRVQRAALEAHLLQQPLEADTLAACLRRDDHLWARSVVLQALRAAGRQPSPGRLRPDEHLRRLHTLFSTHIRPLRPTLLRPNLFALAALVALWTVESEPASVPLRYGIVLATALLVVELVEARMAWRAQDAADSLALGLSGWALDHTEPALREKPPTYRHQRLYLDRPWAGV